MELHSMELHSMELHSMELHSTNCCLSTWIKFNTKTFDHYCLLNTNKNKQKQH